MHRYLLVTWDGGGVIPPELGIARRLIAHGHEVRVLGDPTMEPEVVAVGCSFTPWTSAPHLTTRHPDGAIIRDWETKNLMKLLNRYMGEFLAEPTPRWLADVEAELDARPVDAMLVDFAIPAANIAAQARRIPLTVLMPNCWIIPTKGIPPVGPGFQPSSNPFATARDAVMRSMMTRLFNKALPDLNAARTLRGLPPVASTYEQMLAGTTLVLTSPVFDFTSPHQPASVRYAGPILDDPDWAHHWESPWPADDDRPLVLVGMSSTFQNQTAALNEIADALATLPVRALITLGPVIDPADVPARSGIGDVVVIPSAPHTAVLQHAQALITHCGHGTAMKGLAAGVPIVGLPMGRDQNDTAARIVHHGAGIRLKPTAGSAAIAKAVQRVLADATYRNNAQRLADAIASGEGCVDPVAEIEATVIARGLARE